MTAVFDVGDEPYKKLLGATPQCTIPWEVMQTVGAIVRVGVFGTSGSGGIVRPAVYAILGTVKPGANTNASEPEPPPTDIYAQVTELAE